MFFAGANNALACSCSFTVPVDLEFSGAQNVAILEVQAVEKYVEGEKGFGSDKIKQSRLTVRKVFKGNLKVGQEIIFPQGGGADCIWTFDEQSVGTEFLFYLSAKPIKNNIWAAGTCSRSRSVKHAHADILYLENLTKVLNKTRLSGTLTQSTEAAIEGEKDSHDLLAAKTVRITGNGKDLRLKTDEYGVYEIYDLPAGKYKITPEKIDGFKLSNENNSVEVEVEAENHTEEDFNFTINNQISGKFFDSNGKPLKGVCLDLLPARGEKQKYFRQYDCTKADGTFKFDEIPAGTYIIVVNDDGEITADEPFKTFYYPNVASREDAAAITIGAGDFHDDIFISAQQAVETITVSGVLLFEDGKPAAEESVRFFAESNTKETDRRADASTRTDAKGRFALNILKGQTGIFRGSMYTYSGEYEKCPKLEKLIRAKGRSLQDIETPPLKIEAVSNLSGVELMFPFPSCTKANTK